MALRVFGMSTVICAVLAFAAHSSAQSLEVPVSGGAMLLNHPEDWKASVSGPLVGPTVRLRPGGKQDFEVLITAIVSPKDLPEDAELRRLVTDEGQKLLPTAVQKKLDVQPVKGAEARGYVFHLTEQGVERGPGDFKELHRATVVVRPLLLSVTVLTHSGDNATVTAALKTVAGARYKAAK